MPATAVTTGAVREVLDRFAGAYSTKDVAGVLGSFDDGPETLLVGTGVDEWRVGPEQVRLQAERDFSQARSLTFEYHDLDVGGVDGMAWFAARGTVRADLEGTVYEATVRLTGVVARRAAGWRIVQAHLSVPAAGQEAGSSF
jgi:ketosteroid isomerase-like protein